MAVLGGVRRRADSPLSVSARNPPLPLHKMSGVDDSMPMPMLCLGCKGGRGSLLPLHESIGENRVEERSHLHCTNCLAPLIKKLILPPCNSRPLSWMWERVICSYYAGFAIGERSSLNYELRRAAKVEERKCHAIEESLLLYSISLLVRLLEISREALQGSCARREIAYGRWKRHLLT